MTSVTTVLVLAIVSMVVGILVGRCASSAPGRTDALGFGLLGLLVGTLIGLSQSPVTAAAITAGVGVATTLLARAVPKAAGPEGGAVVTNLGRSDWLAALAGAILVGVVFGVVIRANDLLNFNSPDLRVGLRAQGFNDQQVEAIMTKIANEITYDAAKKTADKANTRTFIQDFTPGEK